MRDPWFLVPMLLLVVLTGYTRLAAPAQMGVVIDEMQHLESWRNRYRTDDAFPLFVEKLERGGMLPPVWLDRFKRLYAASPIVQRSLFVLVDGHPPGYSTMSELIEAVTHSNLWVARLPSVLASILAVFFMYRLGRTLMNPTLGLWLASLIAIAVQAQMYAGVARPYAMGQFGIILTLYAFVRDRQLKHRSPWRLWLAALFAQVVQWFAWAIVGPLVVVALVARLRAGQGLGRLFVQTWWYALASFGLLAFMAVQLQNPTLSQQTGSDPAIYLWLYFSWASPFAAADTWLGVPDFAVFSVAALLLLSILGMGLIGLLADPGFFGAEEAALRWPSVRVGLVAALVSVIVAQLFIGSSVRFMMSYVVVPVVLGGLGVCWLCRRPRPAQIALTVVLAVFLAGRLIRPEDPYLRIFRNDTDYALIAERLASELQPGDTWCAWPYARGNALYRHAELPEPRVFLSRDDFSSFVDGLPRAEGATFIFTRPMLSDAWRTLRRADGQKRPYQNHFVLLRIPPRSERRR